MAFLAFGYKKEGKEELRNNLPAPDPGETIPPKTVPMETVHENYYLIATREVESARRKEPLREKAVAFNDGLQEGAETKYIALRAKRLQEAMGPLPIQSGPKLIWRGFLQERH